MPNVVIKKRVSAVIVTYNRKDKLKRCIDAVKNQETKPSNIIVINNGSYDGTTEMLNNYDDLHVINQENLGGAGGFYRGIAESLYLESEWIWLMDDDGVPNQSSLKEQLERSHEHNLKMCGPIVRNEQKPDQLAFGLNGRFTVGAVVSEAKGKVYDNHLNAFNGTLIHTDVCRQIGNIKKEMFIWGDEREYVLRAKKYGVKMGTAVDAIFDHPEEKSDTRKILWGLLGVVHIKPTRLAGVNFRNMGFLLKNYSSRKDLAVYAIKHVVYFATKLDFKMLRVFIFYFRDGTKDIYDRPNFID